MNYWLVSPDKSSPFRWIGCWCAAVYGTLGYEKAERRVERSRTRRGTKKRGKGSHLRWLARRALVRVAPDPEVALIRSAEKAERARARIDKLHDRGLGFGLKVLARVAEANASLLEIDGKIKDPKRAAKSKLGLRKARDRLRTTLSTLRSRSLDILSGCWGLPRDATSKRILRIASAGYLHAIPRMTLAACAMAPGDMGAAARGQLLRAYGKGPVLPPGVSCPCRSCRTSIVCPDGHGVAPGFRNCVRCGWVRSSCLGPSVRRADGIGRRERNRILSLGSPLRPT